jgi:3D (Asp-Asp-Asp) domain-containing protein
VPYPDVALVLRCVTFWCVMNINSLESPRHRGAHGFTGMLRTALAVAFLGGVVSVASFVLLPWGDGHEAVREVNGVRHPAVPGVPGDAGRTMVASYYGYELEGSPTASGRAFDPEGYTAAHRTLPLGTRLRVSYGGESVQVIVNDRGSYVPGQELDLSLAAAREIGLTGPGSAPVRVTVL